MILLTRRLQNLRIFNQIAVDRRDGGFRSHYGDQP
jgi:hypothetical protein